jgi:type 1 glutamine amidotransferase
MMSNASPKAIGDFMKFILTALLAATLVVPTLAQDKPAPLKALLITGGCCHDYKKQKDILKEGLEKRLNIVVTQMHTDNGSTKPDLPLYGNADYANGYDLVIHDECAADINNVETVKGVLKPHRDGIPGINLHCGMHSYRTGDAGKAAEAGSDHALWFDYLGLQSSGHGPQKPIAIVFLPETNSPITKGLNHWTTVNEELYNNIKLFEGCKPLARGIQFNGDKLGQNNSVVAWTNEYGEKKTRVFSTTIGHNNATVQDDRYLDLVSRGILWAVDKINDDGTPKAGYAAHAK